jgi:hypothetical protein
MYIPLLHEVFIILSLQCLIALMESQFLVDGKQQQQHEMDLK